MAVSALVVTGQGASDATPPNITPAITGTLGQSGWYRSDVTVRWAASDPESGVRETNGCDTRSVMTDSVKSFTCSATNGYGVEGSYKITIRRDTTPPTVASANPQRAPDSNGWFNHSVPITFAGSDSTAGVSGCTRLTYDGPDGASARVSGSCTDRAGNVGTRTFALRYDATAPRVQAAPGRRPDRYGWYGHDVRIVFTGRDLTSGIASCQRRVYGAPNTIAASVTGGCVDKAGNEGQARFRFRYSEPLLTPRGRARVSVAPLLDWVTLPSARRYNVQLWRRGIKILSVWPLASRYQLRRHWTYAGRDRHLRAGSYTWYVWPRFATGYGKMLGRAVFVKRAA